MKWIKLGNIFNPEKIHPWMYSHAANPVPYVLDEDNKLVRIFFTSRNVENISYISYADFDFSNDFKAIKISESPAVAPGEIGLFDDSGCAMGCIIQKDDLFYLFYLGWNLKVTVPWQNTIGLAISKHIDGPFRKYSLAPILDRSNEDPFSISYPSVLLDEKKFKMWYGSNLSWGKSQELMSHVIKYAESDNLILWKRTNEVHIPLVHPNEYAISKPWVIRNELGYHMWYSYRGNGSIESYRIGYAFSHDGHRWNRKDTESGIEISQTGWDSNMICYPSIFTLKDKTYMLYNGNDYGKTGFGIALLEKW